MARLLTRTNLRRCIVSQMRSASDEAGGLGKGAGKEACEGSVKEAGGASQKGETAPNEPHLWENGQNYVDFIKRYHSEEVGHHYKQIAFLQSSIERHKSKIRKLLFLD